jgi:hypothetical protein
MSGSEIMARYDRIAALPSPDRARAYSCWSVFRDLEGSDRDPDLARRARLRFLVLRLARRLIDQGIAAVPIDSFERQIESVREELGLLPARDPERARIAAFLHCIRKRTPIEIATAILDLGEAAEAAEQEHAAEEFYHAALDLANIYKLTPGRRTPGRG